MPASIWTSSRGLEPQSWMPMKTVGPGVKEIRVRDVPGAYRVVYLATRRMRFMCCIASKRKPGRLERWMSN